MYRKFLSIYRSLNKDNLSSLKEVYAEDITFEDPSHQINGINEVIYYFEKLYQNIDYIHFDYLDIFVDNYSVSIYWTMSYSHKRLNKGKKITVNGNSLVRFNEQGKVEYHRDFFDLGELLYENLPLLGKVIRYCKYKLSQSKQD